MKKHTCRYQTALNRIIDLYAIDDDNTETLFFKAVKIAEKAILHPLCDAPKCYKQGTKFHNETDTYYCAKHLADETRKLDGPEYCFGGKDHDYDDHDGDCSVCGR